MIPRLSQNPQTRGKWKQRLGVGPPRRVAPLVRARVLRRASAAYLNDSALDRGTLRLTSQSLRFDGWQGSVDIPLQDIVDVGLGTSVLPRHAGIPLLERLWPGKLRYAESLVLTVQVGTAVERRVATVADLKDGSVWRDLILRSRDALPAGAADPARNGAETPRAGHGGAQAR